jgi:uncharacterized membrane protein YidH (DUF202 family)
MTDAAPPVAGLQAERTQLAWARTSLSFGAATALLARTDFGVVARCVVLVLAAAGTTAVWLAGRARQREFAAGPQPQVAKTWTVAVPALLTLALGFASAAIVLS